MTKTFYVFAESLHCCLELERQATKLQLRVVCKQIKSEEELAAGNDSRGKFKEKCVTHECVLYFSTQVTCLIPLFSFRMQTVSCDICLLKFVTSLYID